MTSRFRLFTHYCNPLDEINASTTPRSWVLNDIGQCDFAMSTSDPKCTAANMMFGNLVYIEHIPTKDVSGNYNGRLPDWTGVIMPPEKWNVGIDHGTAFSAEIILVGRAMPGNEIKGSPATIFREIIRLANERPHNTIPIQYGIIEDLPIELSDILKTSAYAHIKTLINRTGMDWDITGKVDSNGRLNLYANLYQRKGITTNFVISETNSETGENTSLLEVQGIPSNVVNGFSQANTDADRVKATAINQAALDDYGLWEINQVFMGMTDAKSVYYATQQRADSRGRPVKIVPKRNVLDISSAYSYLEIGNVVTVNNTTVSFKPGGGFGLDAQARIMTVDYNDNSNNCPVALEVI